MEKIEVIIDDTNETRSYSLIDGEELRRIISDYDTKRILITAPRRSGKTRFILQHLSNQNEDTKVVFVTISHRLLREVEQKGLKVCTRLSTYYSFGPFHQQRGPSIVIPQEVRKCDILYLDEALFSNQEVIHALLGLGIPTIIAISTQHPDDSSSQDVFIEHGFKVMEAPLLSRKVNVSFQKVDITQDDV